MQRGEIVEQGAVRSLFERPQHVYTRRLLASAPTMKSDRTRPLASVVDGACTVSMIREMSID